MKKPTAASAPIRPVILSGGVGSRLWALSPPPSVLATWMIGDNVSDVAAACNAEMQGAVHVLLGHGQHDRNAALALASDRFEVLPVDDMVEALVVLERLGGLML